MTEIVEFLMGQLDREAALAQRVADRYVWPDNGVVESERVGKPFWPMPSVAATLRRQPDADLRDGLDLIEMYGPARVLAEVAAKRAIVAECDEILNARHEDGSFIYHPTARHLARHTLHRLATAYAAQSGFKDEWRLP